MVGLIENEANDTGKASVAWRQILQKYPVEKAISEKGFYLIKAKDIKEFREPRLMAKWDSSDSLPNELERKKLNILPVSRSEYMLSDFNLYKTLPKFTDLPVHKMTHVDVPDFESLDFRNITSESNAINAMLATHILDDFLDADNTVETFNGRMGTGNFNFAVDTFESGSVSVSVNKAQMEIDGGFENEDDVIIMEAKNVLHPDFHIRQLYYPYRMWSQRIHNKPIRLVFSQYHNMIYRLFEYVFEDPLNYSSIKLVNSRGYTFQNISISLDDLFKLFEGIQPSCNDRAPGIVFPQADSFERVISLMEHLGSSATLTTNDITDYLGLDQRQSNYYAAAGEYLGLFDRDRSEGTSLSQEGERILKLDYRERQLALVRAILNHEIFYQYFTLVYRTGRSPESFKTEISESIRTIGIKSDETSRRRASTVVGWLKWIFSLPEVTDAD